MYDSLWQALVLTLNQYGGYLAGSSLVLGLAFGITLNRLRHANDKLRTIAVLISRREANESLIAERLAALESAVDSAATTVERLHEVELFASKLLHEKRVVGTSAPVGQSRPTTPTPH
jgi:hypothetical protein